MEKKSTLEIDAGDAVSMASINRRASPPPGLPSWLALLALAALTAGSLFIAAGLPVEAPRNPSTPLLRQFCGHVDCTFLSADGGVRDVRLAAPAMRPGAASGTLVFRAEATVVAHAGPWPMLVFEFFDADRRPSEVRRITGDEYAPPGEAPTAQPFAVEIAFAGVSPAAAYYSMAQAHPGVARR